MSSLSRHLSRHQLAGWLVLATAVLYILSLAFEFSAYIPGAAAWLAVGFCWSVLSRSARQQSVILFSLGVLMLLWSVTQGSEPSLRDALTRNLPLLTMFVAVSFLALTNPEQEDTSQPTGKKGFWSTVLSCHLLGAAINLSIIFVVGDRLSRKQPLTDEQSKVLMRGYCAGAYWSPFFVAFGVAMTYAPGAVWVKTMVPGLIMAGIMFLLTFLEVSRGPVSQFRGYPLRRDSLVIPSLLAVAVLLLHRLFQSINILTIISVVAPLAAILFMNRRPRTTVVRQYVERRLSNVSSQFSLFLAAGVFSTGVGALIACYPEWFSFSATRISPLLFWAVSAVMILAGLIGMHPVVSVSLVSPFLLPIATDINQLAFLYLSVWGTSTATSPLSGVGLAMVSRYKVKSRAILRFSWQYMVAMWFAAGVVNWVLFG